MGKTDAGCQTKFSAVFTELRGNILGGRYAEGKFPSERALMKRFGVSRTLVRQVIARLKVEGLLASRQGQGTFIPQNAMRMNERLGFIIPGVGREEIFFAYLQEDDRLLGKQGLHPDLRRSRGGFAA